MDNSTELKKILNEYQGLSSSFYQKIAEIMGMSEDQVPLLMNYLKSTDFKNTKEYIQINKVFNGTFNNQAKRVSKLDESLKSEVYKQYCEFQRVVDKVDIVLKEIEAFTSQNKEVPSFYNENRSSLNFGIYKFSTSIWCFRSEL